MRADNSAQPVSIATRVHALEAILVEKGYVQTAALDAIVETYERDVGPRNGARVVARAWIDPNYRTWLLADATAAIASLGYNGRQGEHMVALENTPDTHHLVVCTLCSCYPWPLFGLRPSAVRTRGPALPCRLGAPRDGHGRRDRRHAALDD